MSKSPNPIDVHVGSRVRLRRMLVGMSQEKLGEKLNLTFQQVQKYEKGANRIGSSRLYTIASILNVPVQFFFDDMPANIDISSLALAEGGVAEDDETPIVMDFVNSSEGLQLNTAFSKISDSETRKRIVELVKTLASATPEDQ
ncbi:helix-turn-helix transcriptional regulator [Neomegalonema sp.]|uniref:helix-turn-helix domain-containing protein n=1 Tax=Neomegalonema sp. TaxID=2039713 RepID=UPI002609160A|nr:helix-turn-helix transcriptional regulator [Neomegalonema sp.]MDD2868876.1 helix-turn-helix transcriptional regulator [Neomegalonema sp.]